MKKTIFLSILCMFIGAQCNAMGKNNKKRPTRQFSHSRMRSNNTLRKQPNYSSQISTEKIEQDLNRPRFFTSQYGSKINTEDIAKDLKRFDKKTSPRKPSGK